MRIDVLTLFPKMFQGPFNESIIKRAQKKGLVEIKIHNLRHWAVDKRGTVDDRSYGGGPGMILMVEPIYKALKDFNVLRKKGTKNAPAKMVPEKGKQKVILLSPSGKVFNQKIAQELAKLERMVLICGHYESVDQRVSEYLVDEEISIGDYILTGGEIPAMVVVDALTRLIPGVLEKPEATQFESFSKMENLLEYPQYTKPENFQSWKVPEVLLSGNHQKIKEWRAQQAKEKTKKMRPDLLKKG